MGREAAPAIVRTMDPEAFDPTAAAGDGAPRPLAARWLGRIGYHEAWTLQKRLAAARAAGLIEDQLLLLEHPAVLTLGRGADESHVLATPDYLAHRGIELLRVERGGEVTYHGPGQLVAYPIIRLADRGILLRPFVRVLEAGLATTCAHFGVTADRREGHPGCWVDPGGMWPRKIGALGLRVERGTTYHGIALNVSVDLHDFDLINACGMPGVRSVSVFSELGRGAEPPSIAHVAEAAAVFAADVAARLGAPLAGALPPDADPAAARAALDALLATAEAAAGATAPAGVPADAAAAAR